MNTNIPNNLPTGIPFQNFEGSSSVVTTSNTTHTTTHIEEPTKTDTVSKLKKSFAPHEATLTRALAVVGLFVVLIILIIGAAFTAKYAGVALRSSYAAAVTLSSKIFSTAPKTTLTVGKVEHGKQFTLSWNHLKQATNGSYSLAYPCIDGVYFKASTLDSGVKTILCNKQFDFINHNNQLAFIPYSNTQHSVEVPITIYFTKNGEKTPTVSGVIAVTIVNNAIKEGTISTDTTEGGFEISTSTVDTTKKPTTGTGITIGTPTTVKTGETVGTKTEQNYGGTVSGTSGSYSNPNGKPDLRAMWIDTGILDSNNNFISKNNPSRADRIAVKFRIENVGNKVSGPFRFNGYLPTYPQQTYNAEIQPSIYPGDRIEYTLAFDRAVNGAQQVRIQVDGGNEVNESNETNNDTYVSINIQ